MNAIPRKQRAMVRKGIKLGLVGEIDDNVDRLFAAYASSVHRLGTPVFPKKYFALLKEEFGDDCEVRVITQNGELVAAVLSFYWRDEVVPYYGGGMPLARDVAGNDFMYWNLMQAAAARGCPPVRLRPQQARHRRLRLQEELGLHRPAAALRIPPVPVDASCRTTIRSIRSTSCSSRCGRSCRWRWPTSSARTSSGTWAERVENLLLLIHRIPYPPNKGDKIRSYHLLKHLAQHYRVHLGTFVDDADDWQHVPHVQALCASSHFAPLNPLLARVRSLGALLANRSLSLDYYRNAGLQRWVDAHHARAARSTASWCSRRRWRSTPKRIRRRAGWSTSATSIPTSGASTPTRNPGR